MGFFILLNYFIHSPIHCYLIDLLRVLHISLIINFLTFTSFIFDRFSSLYSGLFFFICLVIFYGEEHRHCLKKGIAISMASALMLLLQLLEAFTRTSVKLVWCLLLVYSETVYFYLSKHYHEQKSQPKIRWSIMRKSENYAGGENFCKLCQEEKLAILMFPNPGS